MAQPARVYPSFPSLFIPVSLAWSNLEYHYSPLDGRLIHCKVTPGVSSGFPDNLPVLIIPIFFTVRVKCFAKTHNIMTWPGLKPRPLDLSPVVQRPISANPRLTLNPGFLIPLFKSLFGIKFCVLFRASHSDILDKKKFNLIFFLANPGLSLPSFEQPSPGEKCTSLSTTVSPTTNLKTSFYSKFASNNISP